jgi:hypothetical protein
MTNLQMAGCSSTAKISEDASVIAMDLKEPRPFAPWMVDTEPLRVFTTRMVACSSVMGIPVMTSLPPAYAIISVV